MQKISLLKILAIFFFTQFLISCGEKLEGPANVTFKIPEKNLPPQKLTPSTSTFLRFLAPGDQEDIWSPAFAPENKSQLNCFGVVITGNSSELSTGANTCEATDGSEFNFGRQKMGATFGDTLSFDELDSGQTVVVRILGWRAENDAACESLKSGENVEAKQLSHPFVIAQQSIELEPGDNDVTISADFNAASKELVNCNNLTPKLNSFSTREFNIGGIILNNKPEFIPGDNLILELVLTKQTSDNPEAEARIHTQIVHGSGPGLFENSGGKIPPPGDDFPGNDFPGNDGPITSDPIVLRDGQRFEIRISQQPAGKDCEVSNGIGIIDGQSYLDAQVLCEDVPFAVSGTVIGLREDESVEGNIYADEENKLRLRMVAAPALSEFPGGEVVALNSQGEECDWSESECREEICENEEGVCEELAIDTNGRFEFDSSVFHHDLVVVFIDPEAQPIGQTCTISDSSQEVGQDATEIELLPLSSQLVNNDDIDNLVVRCSPLPFNIENTISDLIPNRSFELSLFGIDPESEEPVVIESITVDSNTTELPLPFRTSVNSGEFYSVEVTSPATGVECFPETDNVEGTILDRNITIDWTCEAEFFPVTVNVKDIANSGDNHVNISLIAGEEAVETVNLFNGEFTFNTELASGTFYSILVNQNAEFHTCEPESASGEILGDEITDAEVICTPETFNLSAQVAGLRNGRTVTLQNNDGDNQSGTADPEQGQPLIDFQIPVAFNSPVSVTVFEQPLAQNCVVNQNGIETMPGQNTVVDVVCTDLDFTIGGNVTGLTAEESVVLQLNESENLTVDANADGDGDGIDGFTFLTTLNEGDFFDVTVFSSPEGKTCEVTSELTNVGTANVTDIDVTCSAGPAIAQGIIDSSFNFNASSISIDRTLNDNNSQIEIDSSDRLNILFNADSSIESCRFLSDGDFDADYGDAGCVNIETVLGASPLPAAMKVDQNDRQIVTGRASSGQMFIAAFLSDGGGLDADFNGGAGSQVITNSCNPESSSDDKGLSIAIDNQASQNYYIGGHSLGADQTETFSWWKFAENGSLVTSFFQNGALAGHTCTDASPVDTEQVSATVVDSTGTRLISVGAIDNDGQKAVKIVGLQTANSEPDTSFAGGDGVDTFDISTVDDIPNAIALDAQGRIYVAGRGGVGIDGFIARFDANGVLDTDYGTNGVAFLSFGGQESINAIQIDAAGNAVVGAEDLITNNGFVARFDANGILDTNFAGTGSITLSDHPVQDLDIDSLGNIYITTDSPGIGNANITIFKIN